MKVLVVDDHPLVREALRAVFADLEENITVLEAPDSHQAMQLIYKHTDLRLVLLDLRLPDGDGLSLLAELREPHPEIAVLILSGAQDRHTIAKAMDLGAVGFLPKTGQRDVMLGALQLILSGGIYIPPELLAPEVSALTDCADIQLAAKSPPAPADVGLTNRQIDVLALIMQGKSNKAICRALNLAEPTVKNHVTAIFRALRVTNRTEAAISAREFDWSFAPAERRLQ